MWQKRAESPGSQWKGVASTLGPVAGGEPLRAGGAASHLGNLAIGSPLSRSQRVLCPRHMEQSQTHLHPSSAFLLNGTQDAVSRGDAVLWQVSDSSTL